jgi:hypothetical protein
MMSPSRDIFHSPHLFAQSLRSPWDVEESSCGAEGLTSSSPSADIRSSSPSSLPSLKMILRKRRQPHFERHMRG